MPSAKGFYREAASGEWRVHDTARSLRRKTDEALSFAYGHGPHEEMTARRSFTLTCPSRLRSAGHGVFGGAHGPQLEMTSVRSLTLTTPSLPKMSAGQG